ncbi:MAG: aromatic compound degradation protein PaaI [Actinobacteria bacterium 13_2_20CM_2_71_6]|nr:MAG: aromatic compound degradation protein PaaI [Actinobacteria bacterium 13_2_20CM_2_71_6]
MEQTQTGVRSRTFTWSDPAIHAGQLGQRSGLALLRAMVDGELPPPPVLRMLGVDGIEVEEGRILVYLTPQEFHYNPLGTVHGGVLATVLDTATGCAVHSTLPERVGYTSVDLSTKFLRPVTVESGRLRCEGTILSRGRRTALAQATITDAAGRLAAHATSTCLLFDLG